MATSELIDYQHESLSQLQTICRQQIANFKKNSQHIEESLSCLEIVRRAAQGLQEAIAVVLEIVKEFVYAKCPPNLSEQREDLAQEVSIRLIRKFLNKQKPFQPKTFPQFIHYVNLTIKSVLQSTQFSQSPVDSLTEIEEQYVEPSGLDTTEQIEREAQIQSILALLPDVLEREAFLRRFGLEETPDEIAKALLLLDSEMTKQKVYRLVERALRRIKRTPHLQHLR